jgi:hypothetical protein
VESECNVGTKEEQVNIQIIKVNDLGKSLMNYYYKVGGVHTKAREEKHVDLPFSDYPSIEMKWV